jgi:hypothetical protein
MSGVNKSGHLVVTKFAAFGIASLSPRQNQHSDPAESIVGIHTLNDTGIGAHHHFRGRQGQILQHAAVHLTRRAFGEDR